MTFLFRLCALLALLAVAAPAAAQDSFDTRGPFYELGPAGNVLTMSADDRPAPTRIPTSPVTIRAWYFYGAEQTLQGRNAESPTLRFDARMATIRVDCAARTATDLAYSVYAGPRHVRSQGVREPAPQTATAGTTLDAIIRSACEPGFNAARIRHEDFAAARAAAARHFAQAGS
ncbi:MAG: hypothetical protein ACI8U3_001813 [Brevundimonas sp.]|jgi:hypothetical protein|uniref:hypothetical protein n=1 Tax=Brevundimonas sp. TaxID=1871086 RepID=UPI0039E67D17